MEGLDKPNFGIMQTTDLGAAGNTELAADLLTFFKAYFKFIIEGE